MGATIQQQLNAPEICYIVYEDFACRLPTGHHRKCKSLKEGKGATIQRKLNAPENCNVVYEDFVCHLPTGHHRKGKSLKEGVGVTIQRQLMHQRTVILSMKILSVTYILNTMGNVNH